MEDDRQQYPEHDPQHYWLKRLRLSCVLPATVAVLGHATPGAAPRATTAGSVVQTDSADPRWQAMRQVFGQSGEAHDGYFRVNFPRTDLHVRIGSTTLESAFELTSYFGFVPQTGNTVMGMGEVVLQQSEVTRAITTANREGVQIMALHNHLVGETPRVMYLHVMAEGPANSTAAKLRAVIAATATPLQHQEKKEPSVDWSSIDAILGPHAEADGTTAEYVFPRHESHAVHGMPVKSTGMLETASEVVFQRLGGRQVACGGELYVRPAEVQPVIQALENANLHIAALHNHMLDEQPTMYWIHWYGTGDSDTLARGVATALAKMNSARQSAHES